MEVVVAAGYNFIGDGSGRPSQVTVAEPDEVKARAIALAAFPGFGINHSYPVDHAVVRFLGLKSGPAMGWIPIA